MTMQTSAAGVVVTLLKDGGSGQAPEWIRLLPEGEVRIHGDESALMDDEAARLVLAEWAKLGHDMVVDYEHQTLGEGEAPAAAWIHELAWKPEGREPGLWARVSWTARAGEAVAAREYRYLSPVLILSRLDQRVVELYNVALTNQPRMLDAPAIVASRRAGSQTYITSTSEEIMDKEFRILLGLAETATDAEAVTALKSIIAAKTELESKVSDQKTGVVACKEVLDGLGLTEGASKDEVVRAVAGLKAPADGAVVLARRLEAAESKLKKLQADGLVAEALKDGKTSPAEVESWGGKMAGDDPEMYRKVVLSRAVGSVVPVGETKIAGDKPGATGLADDVQLSINKQLGISKETWEKHGPKEA